MSDNTEAPKQHGLVAKLCEVMAEAGYIQKRGRNEKFNYNYATEADVVELLREKLAARNIFVFPSVTSAERKEHSKTSTGSTMFITDIMVKWTFLDGDTGEAQECMMPGCGTDTGDKGIYKAITGSSKYMFLKGFMLPTGDDPENEKADPKEGKAAAKAVAKKQLEQAAKSDNPRTRQVAQEGLDELQQNVTLTPYKEGFVALSGKGLPIVRSNLDNKAMGELGWKWEGSTAIIPAKNGFKFVDLCKKYNVGTTWMEAPQRGPLAPPKANIPPPPVIEDEEPEPSNGSDPIITSAKRVKGNKPGAKEFLSVEWDGKKASCWNKRMWPHLEHHVGRPAVLTLETKGQYTNVVGIVSLDGEEFFNDPVDLWN
jgi:hypothetical protein